jgi:cytoskeletal protein CcmA (bactofilin family)
MDKEEILKKLEERLAKGEISEKTYLDIKARYDKVPEDKGPEMKEDTNGFDIRVEVPNIEVPQIHVDIPTVIRTGKKFVVMGAGHADGDVRAEICKVAGSCTIEGSVDTNEWRSAGSAKIMGNVKADRFKGAGSTVIGGNVETDEFGCAGKCSVGKGVKADMVKFGGALQTGGSIVCDNLQGAGKIDAPSVHADVVKLELEGASSIREMTADSIEVRSLARIFSQGELTSDAIRGEVIYLENTKCKLVSGDTVTIGPNCEIETVEFRSGLKIHLSARVSKKVKR